MKKFIPKFVFQIYHYLLALIGAVIYGFPAKKLIVVGVTGTNGKSTVVHLLTEILEKSGAKTASLSSIRFKIGDKEEKNMLKMTMPGRFKLQKFLSQAVKAGCKYMVLEVTSEGIKQFRHKFIDFNGAVFTNLTKEHIEAHKGFENYRKAKGKLFQALEKSPKPDKFAVLNADDISSAYFDKFFNGKKYFYGIRNSVVEIAPDKIGLKLDNLLGEFNIYNAMAAYSAGIALGIEKNKVLETLKQAKGIPGRLELVIKEPFKVFVDYAHTPDGLEKVYQALGKNLICVLGSTGGGRDKWKRPEMGKIAENFCKEIILTNEDPYNENPASILDEIEAGFSQTQNSKLKTQNFEKILDRREAINKAISIAKPGDVVIITGKGCEPWMCVAGNKKIPWDDREIAKEEFKKSSIQ
jgi:UDP-N-acetylmuramoyl-L-alanyl-D-glutamate--2,6-diaminopimelate ligase